MASTASLLILTLPFYGIQSVWSTEMAFAPPYLLSLGLPRDLMSLVLLAAPLSGLVVQPLIGHYADHSTSKYGRRRPFMFFGSLIAGLSMFTLGYGKPLMEGLFGADSSLASTFTIALAVISVYVVDFSVNAVMAVDRALLVDVLGPDEQDHANAWAARMVQFGQIGGYWIGSLQLPSLFPWLGTSQIQVISGITVISLLVPHILAVVRVQEKPTPPPVEPSHTLTIGGTFRGLFTTIRGLPPVAHKAFTIQFWSWLSQFPVLIYTTVYIGDIYRSVHPTGDPDAGTRAGSRAMFYEAVLGLIAILVVPLLIKPNILRRTGIWTGETPSNAILCAVWASSQAVSAVILFFLSFSKSVHAATVLIALNGYCMTVNHWAPFALVGEAILLEARANESKDANEDYDQSELEGRPNSPLLNNVTSPTGHVSAGAAMGILNAFICVPQFVVIGLSSVLFAILEPHRTASSHSLTSRANTSLGDERSTTLIVIFRFAALSGVIALYYAVKLSQYLHSQAGAWERLSRSRTPSHYSHDAPRPELI